MRKRVLITGGCGQVGFELSKILSDDFEILATDRGACEDWHNCCPIENLDLSDFDKVTEVLHSFHPEIIINTAAYTNTEKAEDEPKIAAHMNAELPKLLADYCKKNDSTLIHFSTDYVFDGSGEHFRDEDEPTNPLSVYGKTKLDGDLAIVESGCKHIVFRTTWVYSYRGHNFLKTILHHAKLKKELSIVSDQIGSPTSAVFIANSIAKILLSQIDFLKVSGVYNLVNAGVCSWHEFATSFIKMAKELGLKLSVEKTTPIPSDAFPSKIKRPKNSRLNTNHLTETFKITPDQWEHSLKEIMNKYCSLPQ